MALELKIDPELSKIFEEVPGWNYEELKEDIREHDIKVSLIIADDGTVIDGHQRLKIWLELERDPADLPIVIKHYGSRKEMIDDAVRINILRRHLTTGQRAYFAINYLLPFEQKKARERMLSGKKDPTLKSEEGSGEAYQIAAKQVGLGKDTLQKAKKVFEKASEKVVQQVLIGGKTVNRAFDDITRKEGQEQQDKGKPLPEGTYDIFYADPPWQYGYVGSHRGAAEKHYKTIPTQDIMDMPISKMVADDAILFLWVTNPMLEDGLGVVKAWGFEYKTNFSWHKDKIAMGFYNRSQHELLLICRRGNLKAPADANRFPSVIQEPRTEHSRKPEVVYGMIEKMYPNRTYIELFARPEERRPGWTYWGLEAEGPEES